jgi:hypothetical protein
MARHGLREKEREREREREREKEASKRENGRLDACCRHAMLLLREYKYVRRICKAAVANQG